MAKPTDWNEMTKAQQQAASIRLLNSPRGSYILGQALSLAIEKLNSVKPSHMRERSNIEDMEMLQELFLPFISDAKLKEVMRQAGM